MNPRHKIPLPFTRSAFACHEDGLLTYPSNRNEKACRRSNEQDRTNPVDALQLRPQIRRLEMQNEKKRNKNISNADERQIKPEDPSLSIVSLFGTKHGLDGTTHPSDILRECSADHGP